LEMAREALRANLRIKLDRKQTAIEKSTRTPSEYEYKRMDGLSREVSHANALGKLYYGGENEVASASGFIKGLEGNEDVRKIFRTPEGLVVQRTVEGGITEETYPFVDENGILMPQEEWIQSVYTTLTPGQDLDLALAQSSYRADREFNPSSRYSFDINMRPDVQPIGDLQFEIGKEKFGVADLFSPVEDKDIVVSAAEDAERVLQKLPSSMTQNLEVRELDSDELDDVSTDGDAEDAIVINMPHVLTAPLIVPSGDKFAGQVRGIVTDLYNAAAEGKRRAPASYKNFFDDGIFSQYNNQYSAGKFEYPEEAITGEVYSRAETDATQTEQFRVLEIEELQEEAAAEMPAMIGGTPANQVDAGAVEPTATAEDEVDAMLEEFRNQQAAAVETAEVANEAEAEVATQADETAKKKDDAVVTAIEEEAPLDDAEKADRRMVTKVFEDKKSQLSWPTTTRQIVRGFGAQQDPNNPQVTLDNKGVDIRTEPNTPVKPSFPGVVTKVFDVAGAGKTVIVSHGNYRTVYSNLKATDVNVGDEITSSDTIGSVVDTTGTPALHFEVWKVEGDSVLPQNPQEWLSAE
jgi:murein DD-endopeptidase MepM/ murein hydrolase activator NlpD